MLRKSFTFAICICQSACVLAKKEEKVACGHKVSCNRDTLIEDTGRTVNAT